MRTNLFLFGIVASTWAMTAQAQPPEPRGDRHGPPHNPIIDALDADRDHEITFDEIEAAAEMLKEQDVNGDKKLTGNELADIPGFGGGPGYGGPGPDGPGRGGPGGGRRGGDGGGMVERLMGFDKNKDGKLAADEVPERMQRLIKGADADEDGFVDKQELAKVTAKIQGGGDSAGRGERERRGGQGPGGRGGPGGPPNPEMMVQHAFEFDADKDGQLSKAEMQAFAKEIGQRRRGPGGRPGRGGPDGRPERPRRPE